MAHRIIYVIMEAGRRGDEPVRRLPNGKINEFNSESEADTVAQELADHIPGDLMGEYPRYYIRKIYTK